MRVPSGVTDAEVFFVALDATDLKTRETGLASFTVYRSRNGGTATAMTTPTVTEIDASNMPGVYALILDEDTTIDAGDDSQEMALHITHAGMAPVTRTIELYRAKATVGETLTVSSGVGEADVVEWKGSAPADLADTDKVPVSVQHWSLAGITTNISGSLSGAIGSVLGGIGGNVTGSIGGLNATAQAGVRNAVGLASANIDDQFAALPTAAENRAEMDSNSTQLAAIVEDTGTTIPATLTTIAGYIDTEIGSIISAIDGLNDFDASSDEVTVGGFSTAAKAEIEAEAEDALQLAIPDSVPADGSIPSVQQGVYMIIQRLTDFAISGTGLTVRKVDGSTTLYTLTLDSSTAPTSSTRSG